MNVEAHWETVFTTKAPDAVSWYRPHLEISLDLIERRVPERSASIIDVGAGESTLVDDLLVRGYRTDHRARCFKDSHRDNENAAGSGGRTSPLDRGRHHSNFIPVPVV